LTAPARDLAESPGVGKIRVREEVLAHDGPRVEASPLRR
jgi:hypothetical protein